MSRALKQSATVRVLHQFGQLPDWVVINAIRYALGRMTYCVAEACDWAIANWSKLTPYAHHVIRSDVEAQFDRETRIPGSLRLQEDREDWQRVRRLWSEPR